METQKRIYISASGAFAAGGDRARSTDIANAAIRAALDWGAAEVAVADDGGLLPDMVLPQASYIYTPLPWGGMDGSYTAGVIFGSRSDFCSLAGGSVTRVYMGGVCIEDPALLAAFVAGGHSLPIIAAVGSDDFARAVKGVMPEIEAIVLEESLHDGSIRRTHPERARRLVAAGIERSLKRIAEASPIYLRSPVMCEVDYLSAQAARRAAMMPGVRLIRARSVAFSGTIKEIEPLLALILTGLRT